MAVKMRPTDGRTKRPRRALLQLDTDGVCEHVENRWERSDLSECISEIPLFFHISSHSISMQTRERTLFGG